MKGRRSHDVDARRAPAPRGILTRDYTSREEGTGGSWAGRDERGMARDLWEGDHLGGGALGGGRADPKERGVPGSPPPLPDPFTTFWGTMRRRAGERAGEKSD